MNAKLERMSNEELLRYINSRKPRYRRLLSSAVSFVRGLLGRSRIAATAGDYTVDVSGAGGIKGQGKLSLKNFKAPNFAKLKQAFAALDGSDDIDELKYTIDRFNDSDNRTFKAAAKQLQVQYEALRDAFNDAFDLLENIADKHLPIEVAREFSASQVSVQSVLKAYNGEDVTVESEVLVAGDSAELDFVQYTNIEDVIGEPMLIAVTCRLSPVGSDYIFSTHVNLIERFQAPTTFAIGEQTTNVAETIRKELALHGIVATIGSLKINADPVRLQRLLNRLPFVSKVELDDDAIYVSVEGDSEDADQGKEIFALLRNFKDIKTQIGRTKRLFYRFEGGRWMFTLGGKD